MDNHDTFEEWFEQVSISYYNDAQCPDPFKKKDILRKWLRNAWSLGYNSAIIPINEKY